MIALMNPKERAIMPKREFCLVVDVETAGGFESPLVYDVGLAVVERATGRIVDSWSLILADVFYKMPEKMATAYYAAKVPEYRAGIATGEFRVATIWQVWRLIRNLQKKYNIRRAYAYNAKFDKNALDNTFRTITDGKFFFPRDIEWCCIWHMACQTILSSKAYIWFAVENGFVSEAGNIRTSAECAYAYIIGQPDYQEPHTGLEDVIIETDILHRVLRQKKSVDESIAHNPWQLPQTA
jgi:hypothetical protein